MADLTGMLQAAAGNAGGAGAYIEDVFSTYLYTGNGTTGQDITNGIDLAGEGGLVWIKSRSHATNNNLFDTERGNRYTLLSNSTAAQSDNGTTYGLTAFNSDGFSVKDNNAYEVNASNLGQTYASWTFRKAPKFFDVVTYTGTGSARTVSHNLGSVPGCIIVKRTDTTGDWQVYHRANTANPETDYLVLNSTAATVDSNTRWNDTLPTDSVFTVGTEATVNASGGTYVAYLFAHDAGGFGDDGEQNVISCGSFVHTNTGGTAVNLGWEPQFIIAKNINSGGASWILADNMRGLGVDRVTALFPNNSNAESTLADEYFRVNSTGFTSVPFYFGNGNTVIYIAIRRGPMKTPESGTEVFAPSTANQTANVPLPMGFPTDMFLFRSSRAGSANYAGSRLQGALRFLETNTVNAEAGAGTWAFDSNIGMISPYGGGGDQWQAAFRRAPGFFDVVCSDGDGSSNRALTHNLNAVPELIIGKNRDSSGADFNWQVGSSYLTASNNLQLNLTDAQSNVGTPFGTTAWTSTQFYVGSTSGTLYLMNRAGQRYVYYLFASLAGVSKVGSYTGTGTTLQIDCGFSAGARLVLIKRTDSTGDWYVWDSARGIVSGNDPYLLLNSTAAEVTSTDYIDPYSAGFEISSTAPAAINASGGTFIYFSVA